MKFAGPLIAGALMSACAGHIETRKLGQMPDKANGVIFYAPTYVKVTYEYTALVDGSGRAAKRAGCRITLQKEEIQILPDFRQPYAIDLVGTRMNANKLQVGLTNGMLVSVNAESTPQQAALLTAAGSVLTGIGGALAGVGTLKADAALSREIQSPEDFACNAAPAISHVAEISISRMQIPSIVK